MIGNQSPQAQPAARQPPPRATRLADLDRVGRRRLQDSPGEHAQEHGRPEGHAGEDPGVGGPVAEAAEDEFVEVQGEVGLRFERARRMVAKRHEHHQRPVAGQQSDGEENLAPPLEVQYREGGDHVAAGNRLQRVAEQVQLGEIVFEQIALGDHAEHEQDDEPLEDLQVEPRPRLAGLDPPVERQRHHRSDDEQKQRHDQVPGREADPLDVCPMWYRSHSGIGPTTDANRARSARATPSPPMIQNMSNPRKASIDRTRPRPGAS